MGRYEGKTAAITGGTSSFGLAAAKLLIEQDARVLITASTQSTLDAALEELQGGVIAVRSDASSLADIDALADRVRAEFGTLDALFVNAGITRFVPIEAMTEEIYDEVFAINAKGAYFTVQKLAPLLGAGSGVVLTTSVANELGIPMISAYAASKAAVRSMARTLGRELLPQGIRVNAVSPGAIDTGILERALPEEAAAQARDQMTEENPMGRFGNPDEVAKALVFLAFEASYNTGSELAVDGGGSQM